MPEEQSKFKKILKSRITLFLLLLAFIWLSVSLANLFYKKYQIKKEIENLKAQVFDLEKSNQQISNLIDYFGSERFLEKEAKEKLNLKKEGEEVVVVEPSEEAATSSAMAPQISAQNQQSGVPTKPETNFVKWWRYFFR